MSKDRFEFARIASPEEVSEYLGSLAAGLKRGEVNLESGHRRVYLATPTDVKLELRVTQKDRKGRIHIAIGWKRLPASRMAELRVVAGPPPRR